MNKKQIEIAPGVTVSESMALYVEHTKYENLLDIAKSRVIGSKDSNNWSKDLVETLLEKYWELYDEINPKLDYLGFSNGEIDDMLKDVGQDAIILALDKTASLDLLYAHSFAYQERKVLFKALAYCTRNELNQISPQVNLISNDITNLMPIGDLGQSVLDNDKFLPNQQIGHELKVGMYSTINAN